MTTTTTPPLFLMTLLGWITTHLTLDVLLMVDTFDELCHLVDAFYILSHSYVALIDNSAMTAGTVSY